MIADKFILMLFQCILFDVIGREKSFGPLCELPQTGDLLIFIKIAACGSSYRERRLFKLL